MEEEKEAKGKGEYSCDEPGTCTDKLKEHPVRMILKHIGENPDRDGLLDTPARVVRSWQELYSGYSKDPKDILKVFQLEDGEAYDQIILLKGIEVYSMCEHHMLPFIGKAHVAYIPGDSGKVVGISKLARILEIYSRRLQIQERLGQQVVNALVSNLNPKAAACVISAKHLCMCARGVGKQHSEMVTSALAGAFLENAQARAELMQLIERG